MTKSGIPSNVLDMIKVSKPIKYKGHLIEILRFSSFNPGRTTKEDNVQWSAKVDGLRVMAYCVCYRSSALESAKQIIDMAELH
jgi:hypothetical protein